MTRAVIYTRISLASLYDTTKTDDQERICREMCAQRGWEPVAVFCDHSRSAWKRNRKREGWDGMLGAIRAGQADVIVTYWGDRLVRQPRDLEDLLDLRYDHAVRLVWGSGEYDFRDRTHRGMIRNMVQNACAESDAISDRKKAEYDRKRREGRVRSGGRGGRAFGFETDGITHRADEAALVREAAQRILLGESTAAVARSFAARGVTTTAGNPVNAPGLRKTLALPRYAGLMPDGVSPAAWEPVMAREDHERLRAVLAARGKSNPAPSNERRHLLSGIARCGAGSCGAGLLPNSTPTQAGYCCYACGKVWRTRSLLDAFVAGRVVKRLANPVNPAGSADDGGVAAELAAMEARRAATVKVIEDLADHPEMSPEILMRSLASFDRRIGELRGRLGDGGRARLLARYAGISLAEWEDLDLSVRRSLVSATFRVIVLPASRRGPGFNPSDVLMSPL